MNILSNPYQVQLEFSDNGRLWMKSDMESITVTRPGKYILSIATLLVIVAGLYASSPWLVSNLLRSQLAGIGMRDVQVQVDYPGLSSLMLHGLSFNGSVAGNTLRVEVPTITVNYQLLTLITGQLQRAHIPEASIQMRLPDTEPATQAGLQQIALPIGLLSGQWLSDIPVEVLMLDRLQLDANTATGTSYRLQLNTQLHQYRLKLAGELLLPQLTAPLTLLADTSRNGQAHVLLLPNVEGDSPLFTLEVSPQAHDPSQTKPDKNQPLVLKGQLHTQLDRLLPVLEPVLSSLYPWLHSAAGMQGNLSSQWHVEMVNHQWQVTGKVNIAGLDGQWGELKIPPSEWQGSYQLNANKFEAQSIFKSFEKKVHVDLSAQHDLNTGQGKSEFKLVPIEFNNDKMRLSKILKDRTLPFDLTQGRVSGSGTVVWKKKLQGQALLQLEGVGGHYNEISFEGMHSAMYLAYDDGLKTRQPVPMTVKYVNVGFPIDDVSMNFEFSPIPNELLPLVKVNRFEANMLGGRAFGGPFDFDVYREKNAFVVQLEGLGVHNLMDLERQEGLSGDGKLDGRMPVEIVNKEITISEGKLVARDPGGVIQYKPTAKVATLAKTNASVGLMVKALSYFKYDVLDVNTNYKPGGDLHLHVRLQGHNPGWQDGQPINLNLNLQENIPALLRSLQLSSEISEQVKKGVLDKSN